jgi:HEAT repeat protein
VDKAIAVLQGNDEFAKNRAAEDLARTPPNSKQAEVAKLLAANLNSQNPFTRSSCLKALTTWAGKDEIAVMIKHVDHEDVGFRREVIETLGKMKVADASEPIAERLADFFARPQAADALTKIGAPAEKAVADKLRHQDAQVRQEAAKILMRIATKESVPALRAACDDEDRAVGSYARVALRRLGEDVPTVASGSGGSRPRPGTPASSGDSKPMEGMDKLLEDLNSPFDSAKRRAACEVLVKKEPAEKRDEVAVALNRALEDREPLTRRAAVRALATWGTKENIPNLVKLLEDQDSFVRYATFETLAKFKDERAIDPIAKRLENSLDRPEASKALQEMGSMVEKIVILGLRSRDPLTRAEVCIILKAVGTKESVATLNQFVIANRNGDRKTAGLADEAIKAINEREKDRK